MDAAAFERVYEAFGEFHSFFAPLFGRSESRDYSRNYLRVLLVQSQGTVPGPAQRRESLRVGGGSGPGHAALPHGRPRKPKLREGQRRTMEQRSDELPDEAWREITVAQGSQGPRSYLFSAQRVRPTAKRRPGEIHWAIWRRNLDGSEPRYYLSNALSNAPEDTPLETLAYVGGSRWRIETEFETEKSDVGLDEYETRT